jgi:hypothetical protein
VSFKTSSVALLKKLPLLAAALPLAAAYVIGGGLLSDVGMDWGYYFIKSTIGQEDPDGQFWGAAFLYGIVAPSIYFPMALAITKGVLGGKRIWTVVQVCVLGLALWFTTHDDPRKVISEYIEIVALLIGFWSLNFILFRMFDWIFQELSLRIRAARLMCCPLIAFAPIAVAEVMNVDFVGDSTHSWQIGLLKYFIPLFVAGFFAPLCIGAYKRGAAFAACLFALLPILLFDIANAIYGFVFQQNLHSVASAACIATVSAVAMYSGAFLGSVVLQFRRQRI